MNLNNKIGWCDATWNVYHGCKNTCEFCYARKLAEGRLKGRFGYENGFEPTFHPDRLQEPYHRKTPTKIFVSSMGDLFGDWMLPGKGDFGLCCINRILKVVDDNPQHTFQFLTKYPHNLRALLDYQRENMCIGTTVTCSADMWRVDKLQRNVSGARFISFEPLLGHIGTLDFREIDWVIIGAETGNRVGKVSPEFMWISWLTNAAEQSDIPVYHKDNLRPHVPDLYVLRKKFPNVGSDNDV